MSAAGYVIVELKVSNPERFKAYSAISPATVTACGGEYLVRGGTHEVLEGGWQPQRLSVLRFPSVRQAQEWYDSERYRQARAKRAGATEFFNMVVVEGVAGVTGAEQQTTGKVNRT